MSDSFNFQTSTNSPISDGATALKLEDEVQVNNDSGTKSIIKLTENINETSHVMRM